MRTLLCTDLTQIVLSYIRAEYFVSDKMVSKSVCVSFFSSSKSEIYTDFLSIFIHQVFFCVDSIFLAFPHTVMKYVVNK